MGATNDILAYWRAIIKGAASIVLSGFGYGRPVQISVPLLLIVVGLVRFKSEGRGSQEVFDQWDAILSSVQTVGIVAGAIFLIALLIVPARFHQRQERKNTELLARIERLEGGGKALSLDINAGDVAIIPSRPGLLVGASVDITPGIHVVLPSARVTNRTMDHVVLVPTLYRRLPDQREWKYSSTQLPPKVDYPLSYGPIVMFLGGRAFPPVINLGPVSGDSGRISFRVPGPNPWNDATLTEKIAELQNCEFELEFYDTLSGSSVRQKIHKTGAEWRVVS